MRGEQAVHHAASVRDRALAHVNAREVESQPRVVGRVQQRVFEQAARAAEIAARFGGARLRGLRLAAQTVDAAGLRLLFGVQLIGELQRLVAAALRGERADQPANRVGIVGLAAQRHPVRLFRAGRVVVGEQHFAEQHLRGDVGRIQRDRALEQRLRLRELAVAARADRVARVGPVGRAIERGFPARRIAAARRAFQIVARLGEVLLLQRGDAHAAERVGIVRTAGQHRRKLRARGDDVVAIECGETVGDRSAARIDGGVFLRARAGRAVLLHHRIEARLDGGVVGRGLQIGLVQRGVGRPRVQPQQRLPPALFRRRADRAVGRELLQPRDAVAARDVAVGQMLRIGERVARVVGVVARELFEAAARLIPALRRGRQRLVVLELQLRRRRFALERALIFLHRARALAALREPPRVVDGLVALDSSRRAAGPVRPDSDSSARPPSGAPDIAARRRRPCGRRAPCPCHTAHRAASDRCATPSATPARRGRRADATASTCPDRSARSADLSRPAPTRRARSSRHSRRR